MSLGASQDTRQVMTPWQGMVGDWRMSAAALTAVDNRQADPSEYRRIAGQTAADAAKIADARRPPHQSGLKL